MKKQKKTLIIILMIILMSLIYSIPIFNDNAVFQFHDQDTLFHLSRILGLSNVWSSPVNFNNFHHNGTMMNIFYPWLTLYPAYLLFKLTDNLVFAYQAYYFIVTMATMGIAYFSVFQIKKNQLTSLIFSLVYTFSAYRATDIFQRGSLGEAVALTFLPLIFAGCYHLFIGNYKKWYYVTIGMTLLLYTHLLSVAMVAAFISIIIILTIFFWDKRNKRIFLLLFATMSTVLLSLSFLLPFYQQSNAQEVKVPSSKGLVVPKISDTFTGILTNDLQKYTVGLLIFICLIFTLFNLKKLNKSDRFIFFFGVFILLISTSAFPWAILNNCPIVKLQFVWRLNAFSSLFIAYGFSQVFNEEINVSSSHWIRTSIMCLLILAPLLHITSTNQLLKREKLLLTSDSIESRTGEYYHTDYANKKSLNFLSVTRDYLFYLNNEPTELEYSFTDSTYSIIVNNTNRESKLITPLYRYLGQKITVNNHTINSTLSKYGTTEITVPPGQSNIEISYYYTPLAKVSRIVSSFFFIIFVALVFFLKIRGENTLII